MRSPPRARRPRSRARRAGHSARPVRPHPTLRDQRPARRPPRLRDEGPDGLPVHRRPMPARRSRASTRRLLVVATGPTT